MSEIQVSLFSKPLPSITCPSQMPSCNSDLRLSLISTVHNEDEETFDDIFSLISPVIKGMDVSMTTSAAMLSSAIIFTSHAYKMPLVDTMEMIKDHPRHLEHFSVRPMGKLPASKRLVIANNSLYAKDLVSWWWKMAWWHSKLAIYSNLLIMKIVQFHSFYISEKPMDRI